MQERIFLERCKRLFLSLSLSPTLLSFIVIAVLMIWARAECEVHYQHLGPSAVSGAVGAPAALRIRRPPQTFNEMQQAAWWFHTSSPGAHNDPRHTHTHQLPLPLIYEYFGVASLLK